MVEHLLARVRLGGGEMTGWSKGWIVQKSITTKCKYRLIILAFGRWRHEVQKSVDLKLCGKFEPSLGYTTLERGGGEREGHVCFGGGGEGGNKKRNKKGRA